MSYWTHIIGVIYVDTYTEVEDIKSYVTEALRNAPKITGSERDASVFVNEKEGYCVYTSFDCNRCEYKDTIQHFDDGFTCEAPEDFICPSGKYQTRAIITVCGDLRDRMKAETKKEWNAFHRYIAKELGFGVRIATCRIEGY